MTFSLLCNKNQKQRKKIKIIKQRNYLLLIQFLELMNEFIFNHSIVYQSMAYLADRIYTIFGT